MSAGVASRGKQGEQGVQSGSAVCRDEAPFCLPPLQHPFTRWRVCVFVLRFTRRELAGVF